MGFIITLSSYKYFFPYTTTSSFLVSKQAHYTIYLPALYGHISSSGLILIIGFLGFFKSIRQRWIDLHRVLGKIYVFLTLIISAPCGFIMACYASGGWPVQSCFLILSTLWWLFTWQAWKAVMAEDFEQHRNFMLRSYSLVVSAICLRLYSFIVVYFWSLQGPDVYVWLAWTSWLPNLILVELYLKVRKQLTLDRSSILGER